MINWPLITYLVWGRLYMLCHTTLHNWTTSKIITYAKPNSIITQVIQMWDMDYYIPCTVDDGFMCVCGIYGNIYVCVCLCILVIHLGQQQNSLVYRWQFIVFGFVSSPCDTNLQGADPDAIDTEAHTYMLTTMACYEFDRHWAYTEVHSYHYYIPDSQTWLAPCSDWEKYP